MVGVITDIKDQTPDVKTFRVVSPQGGKLFEHMPGQCAMLAVPGVGEAMFSITSSPTNQEYQEFSIKRCGSLTDLFALPFNHHPVIERGLLEDEAQALLQEFFVRLREKRKAGKLSSHKKEE